MANSTAARTTLHARESAISWHKETGTLTNEHQELLVKQLAPDAQNAVPRWFCAQANTDNSTAARTTLHARESAIFPLSFILQIQSLVAC